MIARTPPRDVAPGLLFRRLLETPRPVIGVDHRIDGFEDVPLSVVGISSRELADLTDGAGRHVPPRLLSFVLRAGKEALSGADLLMLPASSYDALGAACMAALGLCPLYVLSDVDAWTDVLREGAKSPSVFADAIALGGSIDVAPTGHVIDRPDRFFGVPFSQLLDGHWMAFRAAGKIVRA